MHSSVKRVDAGRRFVRRTGYGAPKTSARASAAHFDWPAESWLGNFPSTLKSPNPSMQCLDFYAECPFPKGRMIPAAARLYCQNIEIMDKSMLLEYKTYPLPGVDEPAHD